MRKYLIILLVLFSSCAAKKEAAEFEARPDWVKQKPIISGYYVGIASVKKVGTSAQYIAKARQQALADLAEGVSSSVSATSVLHTIETEYGVAETFDQKIQVSTDDYLEGFDPVDSYENESSYWVYYKISKMTYHEMKEKKKQEAVATALAKYESGLKEQNVNKPQEAISFYLQGLQAIKRYLNEETPADLNGEKIDIGNKLYASTSEILNALEVNSKVHEIEVKRGEAFSDNLKFLVTYNNNPVQGIPVEFKYTGGYLKKDRQTSDADGYVQLEPEILYSRNGKEQITADINLKELAQKSVDDVFIRRLVVNKKLKPASVQVIIVAPSVFIKIDENNCNEDDCNKIKNIFNENAKRYGYELKSESTSDFIFSLSFVYKQGERAGGLVSAYISGELTIKDASGNILWAKQTEDIKGVGNNMRMAKNEAYKDFLSALNRKYFKQGLEEIK